LRRDRKTLIDGAKVTCFGKLFRIRIAAAEAKLLPAL